MKFTKSDLIQIENLMKITRQGSFTLTGTEALAFSQCINWLAGLHVSITKQMEEDNKPPMIVSEQKSPIQETKKKVKKG